MSLKIQLEKVGLRLGRKWLFRNLSIELESGQSWAILGPNGAGKTSFLSLVAGYLSPTEGVVRRLWQGKPMKERFFLTRLFWQSPATQPPPDFTVADIVGDIYRQKLISQPIKSFYEEWNLPPTLRWYELSSGMKQRLLLGLALRGEEGLILLDEPTTFLDPYYQSYFSECLKKCVGNPNFLVICATNHPQEALLFSHSINLPNHAM
ncbi:MAG: ABC transporter ATP-binding protein [Bacteroidia bacterium]|nr:ABC transporter ATP-binding protein [Bacteroidia bacterium]MDW8134528.1 ABC transporter ATP-binding protein [Bacteroidia bacterium]